MCNPSNAGVSCFIPSYWPSVCGCQAFTGRVGLDYCVPLSVCAAACCSHRLLREVKLARASDLAVRSPPPTRIRRRNHALRTYLRSIWTFLEERRRVVGVIHTNPLRLVTQAAVHHAAHSPRLTRSREDTCVGQPAPISAPQLRGTYLQMQTTPSYS